MKRKIWILLVVIAIVALFATPVMAFTGHAQEAAPQVAELNAEFLAFLIAITGFLKEQFGLKGKVILAVAFGVGLFLYYSPLLPVGSIVDQVVLFIKWFLAGVGGFDTTVDVFAKVAKKLTPQ